MTTTDPNEIRGLIPYVMVRDAAAAAEFYGRAFGAEVLAKLPHSDGKRLMHCHLRVHDSNLFINDPMPEYGYPLKTAQSFTLHLQVDDPDAAWQRAVDAGAEIENPIKLEFWGDRYGVVRDPFGIRWSIGGPAK